MSADACAFCLEWHTEMAAVVPKRKVSAAARADCFFAFFFLAGISDARRADWMRFTFAFGPVRMSADACAFGLCGNTEMAAVAPKRKVSAAARADCFFAFFFPSLV